MPKMVLKTPSDSAEKRVRALAKVSYFSELSQTDLQELAGATKLVHLQKGELLFEEGAPCIGLYVIATGRVKVFKLSPMGREQVLHAEREGALGEGPLMDANAYPASAGAMEPSEILFLPKETLFGWCRRQPDIALGIARVLARRVRRFAALAEELALRDVEDRLADYLLCRAEESGRPLRDGMEIVLTDSNQIIADQIGTVREVVSRSLTALQRKGVISISRRRLTVANINRLRAAARTE
jgi:CRP-like cAMP-binding protein